MLILAFQVPCEALHRFQENCHVPLSRHSGGLDDTIGKCFRFRWRLGSTLRVAIIFHRVKTALGRSDAVANDIAKTFSTTLHRRKRLKLAVPHVLAQLVLVRRPKKAGHCRGQDILATCQERECALDTPGGHGQLLRREIRSLGGLSGDRQVCLAQCSHGLHKRITHSRVLRRQSADHHRSLVVQCCVFTFVGPSCCLLHGPPELLHLHIESPTFVRRGPSEVGDDVRLKGRSNFKYGQESAHNATQSGRHGRYQTRR
mmetsp:Transcript_26293/g.69129  ORF Transcript_26293/g.69129 Transcript_26293/m.69129 type:complete len:258 (+) Transcript_26293:217-990(+)